MAGRRKAFEAPDFPVRDMLLLMPCSSKVEPELARVSKLGLWSRTRFQFHGVSVVMWRENPII